MLTVLSEKCVVEDVIDEDDDPANTTMFPF